MRLVNSVSVLQWKVAQVKNVTSFDVERKAGNTWENIGNVVVTSALQNDYNFKDVAANNGINYYRLKINDGNGSFIYSNIVSVSLKTSFLVFQNSPSLIFTSGERSKKSLSQELSAKRQTSPTLKYFIIFILL